MPRRSPEYMAAQRERFCEGAMACFRRKGVVATSLTDICDEVGLSMGALYKHFSSRDDLIDAVLELRLAQRNARLRGDSWAELRTAILRYRDDYLHDTFWRELQGVIDWNEHLRSVRVREGRVILAQIEQLLERYAAAGEITPPFDAQRSAQLVSVIFDGSITEVRAGSKLHVPRQDVSDYLDLAVGARSSPAIHESSKATP